MVGMMKWNLRSRRINAVITRPIAKIIESGGVINAAATTLEKAKTEVPIDASAAPAELARDAKLIAAIRAITLLLMSATALAESIANVLIVLKPLLVKLETAVPAVSNLVLK